jgi:flagellar M-ring protein FliF
LSPFDSVLESARRFLTLRVLGIVVVVGLGIAGLWGLMAYGNAPQWVPIVQGVPLATIAEAQRALEEAGIENQLSAGGAAVSVRVEQAARARVALAERGVAVESRHPGFELFDQASWGMTDFTQRINYRRALEGELERSISQMRGIRSAEVHLALPQSASPLLRGQQMEASVLLSVAGGARPTAEQVEAITFLVASSVDGLTSENVSVIDDAGRVLSAAVEPNLPGRSDRRRIDMQLDLERHLEARATELVESLVGPANARVRVSARLNLDQVERRTEAVDPAQQVLTSEQRSEITPGDPAQGAASTIQHNTFDVTRRTEISSRAPGGIERLTVAVALNENIPRASDPAFLASVRELVSNSVGLDPTRGDSIAVRAVPFELPPATVRDDPSSGPGVLDLVREFQRPIVLTIALAMMFGLALRGLSLARDSLPAGERPLALPSPASRRPVVSAESQLGLLGESTAESGRPRQTIEASRVVRAWLGEG